MNLFKRLHNLWVLSGWDLKNTPKSNFTFFKSKQATIIQPNPTLDDIPTQ